MNRPKKRSGVAQHLSHLRMERMRRRLKVRGGSHFRRRMVARARHWAVRRKLRGNPSMGYWRGFLLTVADDMRRPV